MYKKEEADLMGYAVVLAIFSISTIDPSLDIVHDSYLFLVGYLTGIVCTFRNVLRAGKRPS